MSQTKSCSFIVKNIAPRRPSPGARLTITDCFQWDKIKNGKQNKTKKKKCPTSCCLTHEWHLCKSDWLEDIYIVKEIAGKCHKELTGFDRALRNAAFFFFFFLFALAGILAFWGLKVKWISLICLRAGCSPGRPARNGDSYCWFCQMGFLWRRRERGRGCLLSDGARMEQPAEGCPLKYHWTSPNS